MPLLSYQQFALRNDSLIALLKENVIGREDVRGQLPFDAQGPDAEDEAMRQQDQQTAQQSRHAQGPDAEDGLLSRNELVLGEAMRQQDQQTAQQSRQPREGGGDQN